MLHITRKWYEQNLLLASSLWPNYLAPMKTDLFDFHLPDDRIALRPVSPRDSARLLQVSTNGHLGDYQVSDLPNVLRPGDVLVINDTRVIRAALQGIRPAREHGGGGDVSVTINLHKQISVNSWRAFVRPAKRLKIGDILKISESLSATVTDKRDGGDLSLSFNHSGETLRQQIQATGAPPLPPYIARKRAPDARDLSDYQTVYAEEAGSVAAPTAGLHFTPQLLEAITSSGIKIERLTLHVGAGTFLPVKVDNTKDHDMHSEWYTIDQETAERINRAKTDGHRIIAVGTTTLRALESAAQDNLVRASSGETDIFITPGYNFQVVDGLMTNFHLPRSTLFMLVSALCGLDRMQSAYAHAIKNNYRFYSYGDSSLLWKAE